MAEIIRSTLSKLDLFGQNITLNMNKNALYTTAFGGFSSILIICLVSIIFFSNIVEYFGKQNVSYKSEIQLSNNPEQIIMNDENAMIALSIDQLNFTANPFFNITVERKYEYHQARISKKLKNGTIVREVIEIPLIPCTLDRFNSIFEKQKINFTDQFYFLNLGNRLCPDFNYTFSMQETYSSEIYEYMKITVRDCVNSTVDSQRPWNPICKSETEKTKYLQQNGDFRFQVFQINTVVNPQKPEDYKSLYIDSDIYFQFIPKKTAQIVSLYYRQFLLENDLSILPYEDIQKENITVRKAEDFRAITEVGRDTDDSYSIVYLRRSPFTEIIHRKYEKLGELLAYLGGFMQIMKLVFGLIIAFYNRTAMLVELSNKLYDFNDNSKIQKIKTMKTLRYTNHHISSSGEKQDIAINQINNSEFQKIQWKNYVKQLIRKSKPITFNLKIFFNQLSFGYFFKNKNSEFLEKAMKKINTELDLHSILYQLQEINKLKQVLLRKSQIILFNFSPKPVISLGEDNIVLSRYALEDTEQFETYIKEKEETPKEELFLKLEEAYKEIAEEIDYNKSNICQMNINLKLINLIGSDMKAILKPLIKKQANEKNLLVNEIGDEEEQRDQT